MQGKNQPILMVTYYFPPLKSIGTIRNVSIYRELSKAFKSVHVLSTSNSEKLQKDQYGLKKISVEYLPTLDYRTIFSLKKSNQTHFQEQQKTGWKKTIIKLNDSFPFNLLFGEGGAIYILAGFFRGVQLIRKHQITFLYSSFRPYSDHVICYLLKLFFPSLYWIADFRDPHVGSREQRLIWPTFQRWCNRLLLRKANLITTVSRGVQEHFQEFHDQVYLLRNAMTDDWETRYEQSSTNLNHFRITYTGSLYLGYQDAQILFEVLADLIKSDQVNAKDLKVVYAGKDSALWTKWVDLYGLKSCLEDHGLVHLKASKTLQENSHINILLNWTINGAKGILTGKLYEYLATGNPVLALTNGAPDQELQEILAEVKGGTVIGTEANAKDKLEVFILKYYCEWKKGLSQKHKIDIKILRQYSWEHQGKLFINYLTKSI